LGNNRAVNGRIACLGDSERDKSAEQSVSSDVTNASDYEEFASCRNGRAEFTKAYHHGDSDWGSGCDKFASCRNGRAEFTKAYHHGDSVRF
jgi:hypothetical protein